MTGNLYCLKNKVEHNITIQSSLNNSNIKGNANKFDLCIFRVMPIPQILEGAKNKFKLLRFSSYRDAGCISKKAS